MSDPSMSAKSSWQLRRRVRECRRRSDKLYDGCPAGRSMKDAKDRTATKNDDDGKVLPTVFTLKARCRDCYRCLRVCPVKAIRLQGEQATVADDRCIACGRCIRECPQGAKSFRQDTEEVRRWIEAGEKVAASVAPSFAGLYTDWERRRLPSALRKLGFAVVEETSVGASMVARKAADESYPASQPPGQLAIPTTQIICSACPAAVSYIEIYRPEQAKHLSPVVSPMLAHGRLLKAEGGVDRVVFIGPCVAKKSEAEAATDHPVDAVLTFVELADWMAEKQVGLSTLEESSFDKEPPNAQAARLFALEGGQARTAGVKTDMLDEHLLVVSGMEALMTALDGMRFDSKPLVLEPLFCLGGCVNGPLVPKESPSVMTRRRRLMSWAAEAPASYAAGSPEGDTGLVSLARSNAVLSRDLQDQPSDEEIYRVLEEQGKGNPEERLDCGACGYDTCWDKAIAILQRMAEKEMCIPLMRRLAEQRTDRVIESSPNGIVILDERLRILHTNPAFRKYFHCSDAALGKPISYLMDPAPFERVQANPTERVELTIHHEAYELVCRQLIYCLEKERQFVGVFVNLTSAQASERQLEKLRSRTRERARELLEHQIGMAQKMAKFLGENTALGEELVHQLLQLVGAEGKASDPIAMEDPKQSAGRTNPSGKRPKGEGSSGGGGYI